MMAQETRDKICEACGTRNDWTIRNREVVVKGQRVTKMLCAKCEVLLKSIPQETMYCSKCGTPVTEGDRFCGKCGNAIESMQSYSKVKGSQDYPVAHMLTPPKSEGTAAILAFLLGLFCILGIGHMYASRLGKGLVLFLTGVVCYGTAIAGIILYFAAEKKDSECEF